MSEGTPNDVAAQLEEALLEAAEQLVRTRETSATERATAQVELTTLRRRIEALEAERSQTFVALASTLRDNSPRVDVERTRAEHALREAAEQSAAAQRGRESIAELEKERSQLAVRLDGLEQGLAEAIERARDAQGAKEESEQRRRAHAQELETALGQERDDLAKARAELDVVRTSARDAAESAAATIAGLRGAVDEARSELAQRSGELQRANDELVPTRKAADELGARLDAAQKAGAEARAQADDATRARDELKVTLAQQAGEHAQRLAEEQGRVRGLDRELVQTRSELEAARQELADLRKDFSAAQRELAKLERPTMPTAPPPRTVTTPLPVAPPPTLSMRAPPVPPPPPVPPAVLRPPTAPERPVIPPSGRRPSAAYSAKDVTEENVFGTTADDDATRRPRS